MSVLGALGPFVKSEAQRGEEVRQEATAQISGVLTLHPLFSP